MGGFGSGRWQGHPRKTTVEECLVLDAAKLAGHGIFCRLSRNGSTLEWGDLPTKGQKVGFHYSVTQIGGEGLVFRLRYTIGRRSRKEPVDLPILLQTTQPNFGGVCWWFTCPLELDEAPCGRRVRKLYLPLGNLYFGCRHCHDLTYQSCQESHKFETLFSMRPSYSS